MARRKHREQLKNVINPKLVDFQPEDFEKIKATLIRRVDVVARSFCETEMTMLRAIESGQAKIGTINDMYGRFCIYMEYQGTHVLKPVHVLH